MWVAGTNLTPDKADGAMERWKDNSDAALSSQQDEFGFPGGPMAVGRWYSGIISLIPSLGRLLLWGANPNPLWPAR